jgi:NAD(P)-dependent dehydrogenase (short-subunit alcohol dehydrogenase family)
MNKIVDQLFNLDGRVALITGGAGMLGSEYGKVLSDAGATVVLLDVVKSEKMKKHVAMLNQEWSSRIHGQSVDITRENDVKKVVQGVMQKFRRIDILINNAAMTDFSGKADRFAAYENFPLEVWRTEIDVGLTGSFICAKAVAPHMMKARSGVIVNIASTYGVVAPDNRIYDKGKYRSIGYAAVKSAVLNFTRALASYFAPYGIRVNSLTPGGVEAPYLDRRFLRAYGQRAMLARMAKKEEYRGPMLFLCSDASSYMTGSNLIVDGGWTAW